MDEEKNDDLSLGRPVSFEDFENFAKARNISNTCGVCGSQQWGVVIDVDGKEVPFLPAREFPGSVDDSISLPTIINQCQNCGQIRMFARAIIENWLNEQDSADTKDD